MLNIVIHGLGKLGQTIAKSLDADMRVVAGVDARAAELQADFPVVENFGALTGPMDVLLDCSRPDALPGLLRFATDRGVALVLATTGYSNADLERVERAAKLIPVFQSSNLSLGVALLGDLAQRAAKVLWPCDVEIVEKHHRMKVDAPSGTAMTLAHLIREATGEDTPYVYGRSPQSPPRSQPEIGLHAVRGGTLVGEHSVYFILDDEVIELKHSAQSRAVFAHGAVRAIRFIAGCGPGLYGMKELLA